MQKRQGATDRHSLQRLRINFSWILKLRWAAAAGQLATILFVWSGLGISLPLEPLLLVLALEALTNIILTVWFNGVTRRGESALDSVPLGRVLGQTVLLDFLLLTALLFLTGGPTNPFCLFYVVNIVVCAVALSARWTFWLSTLALACLSLLFFYHLPLEPLTSLPAKQGDAHLLGGHLSVYLRGLLAAFVMAASVIAVFCTRLSKELAELETALDAARQETAHSERLEALGTLSAGAAHELASPLSTIAVVAKDLELALSREDPASESAEDARLIRREVARCRAILDLMAGDAGQSAGEPLVSTSLEEVIGDALSNLEGRDLVQVEVDPTCRQDQIVIPRKALGLALRQIVKNALDASGAEKVVRLTAHRDQDRLRLAVTDQGAGMTAETVSKATEPFFTTKEPGQGMGLGLFLSRTIVDRLGGRIEIDSAQNQGTTVEVTLPLADLLVRSEPGK